MTRLNGILALIAVFGLLSSPGALAQGSLVQRSLDICIDRAEEVYVACEARCVSNDCYDVCKQRFDLAIQTCGMEASSQAGGKAKALSLGKTPTKPSSAQLCVTLEGSCSISNPGASNSCSCPSSNGRIVTGATTPVNWDTSLPYFGPIPEWSARAFLDAPVRAEFLKSVGKANPSLKDVGERIATVLRQTGYSDYGFYRVEGGFATVARLEKIKADGTPDLTGRYYKPTDPQPFGFAGFIAQLIYGPEGFYRVIVLMVTDRAVLPEGGPPTVASAEAWFVQAADRLPPEYDSLPFSNEHQLTALIYEFETGSTDDTSAVVPSRRLSSEQHLKGAGIYDRLGFGTQK
jgi:hypothetical protein